MIALEFSNLVFERCEHDHNVVIFDVRSGVFFLFNLWFRDNLIITK